MNLLHSNTRNRLLSGRVSKLEFIYINRRALRSKKFKKAREEKAVQADELDPYTVTSWFTLTANQELVLEDAHRSDPESVVVIEDPFEDSDAYDDDLIVAEDPSPFMDTVVGPIASA